MKDTARYYLERDGSFVIENFSATKPFSNFFPGIAGIWGIPMWVFYVNRGQGIAGFGIESKDKAIMEFQPANKAYRLTSTQGFRTFIKVRKGAGSQVYEPFANPRTSPFKVSHKMRITSHDMTIEEVNTTLGLSVTVNYFTIPEESFAGLVRHVTVRNLAKRPLAFEMVDGLPVIMPYGQNDWVMKNMCRTIEAWYKVRNLDRKAPYFQLNVEAADVPQVKHIKEGNFYFAFDPKSRAGTLSDIIVDSRIVFGQSTDYLVPERLLEDGALKIPAVQQTDSRTPCSMVWVRANLAPGATKEIVGLTGFAHSVEELNGHVAKVTKKGYVELKALRNREIVEDIKNLCFTNSASLEFNAYAGQTLLDNVLRGGLPISLKTSEGPAVFNVYSRKHGDPERDYNFFRLSPTYLSQGNGNYRDVNQNRRNDVWFNSDLKDSAVIGFLSLIQADGYNPLVVCGMNFVAEDNGKIDALLARLVKGQAPAALKSFLQKGFMPGDLFNYLAQHNIRLKISAVEFLVEVLAISQKYETAQHGEGFWTDHWTYNLDLLESYLALYPENLRHLLLENRQFTFYHNSVYVLPREKRYVWTSRGVRQYESLFHEGKEHKDHGPKLRVRNGEGEVYSTNLLVKLLCLLANKAATLDPSGIGIEMEAGKPNWYDSLNGLPGLLGSSISETFELKRFARFTLDALSQLGAGTDERLVVFAELAQLLEELRQVLERSADPFDYWKHANDAKERYREAVRHGITGLEKEVPLQDIRIFLEMVIARVDRAVIQATSAGGLFPTYFYHTVTHYELINQDQAGKEGAHVRPLEFKRHDLPLFLEGFVHAMRCEADTERARQLYGQIKKSALYDTKLGMYKLNADITSETEEIGRTRVFPRGWLENESIWLHMEYKYLLELLRRGLHKEFYETMEKACVAFMDPVRYGRSILENSSFIVSSAHPDRELHGQGNVARLSGSTAEFVHMWMIMNAGVAPFELAQDNTLRLILRPALQASLFTKQKTDALYRGLSGQWDDLELPADTYAFNFMGRTLVVYHNPLRRDTFGPGKVEPQRIVLHYEKTGKAQEVSGGAVGAPYAADVRAGKIRRIDVHLGAA
ncbi:MAG: hypothetical protein HGA80_00500 [Candidatus Omnitrophica bacterium]|nr:hypothetical protein [Candidatus Omnitrophota bacterium]